MFARGEDEFVSFEKVSSEVWRGADDAMDGSEVELEERAVGLGEGVEGVVELGAEEVEVAD